jgi:F-type H+-transporting ATPase subunit delta
LAGSSTSSSSEAAERYAAAVFDMALEAGAVDAVESGLLGLSAVIRGDDTLARALRSPLYRAEDKAGVLAAVCARLQVHDLVARFAGVAALNGRAGDLAAMAAAFAALAARHRGSARIVARLASAPSPEQKSALEASLTAALGRRADIDIEIDPSLIGGLQVKLGSRLVDASVRTQLNALTTLMKGA